MARETCHDFFKDIIQHCSGAGSRRANRAGAPPPPPRALEVELELVARGAL